MVLCSLPGLPTLLRSALALAALPPLPAELGLPSRLIPVPPGHRSARSVCVRAPRALCLPDALEQSGEEEEQPSGQAGWDGPLGHC